MTDKAIQDSYGDEFAVCYGCGHNNPKGLHIKTYWDGTEGLCRFKPQPYHTAFPGYVYGGLIASLIDCHSTGTATAAVYEAEGREPGTDPPVRFVTGTLTVRYLHPTPVDKELVLRARIKELREKKAVVTCSLYADNKECAQGEVVVIRAPKTMFQQVG
jgi:acyl-coenzyme A thioesterase PaaI-like protein